MCYIHGMEQVLPKTFAVWLSGHADKDTPVGEMARSWVNGKRVEKWDDDVCLNLLHGGWFGSAPYSECMQTLARALASYSTYLARWAGRHAND